jgi:hypothetical protein
MASVGKQHAKLYDLWMGTRPHPTLEARFSESDLEAMFEEDLNAGRTVPLLLVSVIFCGMLLAIASVVLLYL